MCIIINLQIVLSLSYARELKEMSKDFALLEHVLALKYLNQMSSLSLIIRALLQRSSSDPAEPSGGPPLAKATQTLCIHLMHSN